VNLVSESSVGSTNRRVEALVGLDAFRDLAAERTIVSQLTSTLKTPREQLPERIAALVAELKAAEKKIAAFEASRLSGRVPALADRASAWASTSRSSRTSASFALGRAAVARHLGARAPGLRRDRRRPRGADRRQAAVIVATTRRRASRREGGRAREAAAGTLGGGGGGKDDLAQGGGSDVSAIGAALDGIRARLKG
jgi:alanyl-tRNA synthetase